MTMKKILCCVLGLLTLCTWTAQAIGMSSPSGQLKLTFELTDEGKPVYQLTYKGKTVNVLTLRFKQEIPNCKPEPIRAITLKQSNATPLYSIDGFDGIKVGDVIECYITEEIPA